MLTYLYQILNSSTSFDAPYIEDGKENFDKSNTV